MTGFEGSMDKLGEAIVVPSYVFVMDAAKGVIDWGVIVKVPKKECAPLNVELDETPVSSFLVTRLVFTPRDVAKELPSIK